jgi:hypothetical protein
MKPSVRTSPAASAMSWAASTSAARVEYGFSASTCLPAASERIVHSWCIELGRQM